MQVLLEDGGDRRLQRVAKHHHMTLAQGCARRYALRLGRDPAFGLHGLAPADRFVATSFRRVERLGPDGFADTRVQAELLNAPPMRVTR